MPSWKLVIAGVFFLLVSCSAATGISTSAASADRQVQSPAECPSQRFDTFLQSYGDRDDVQRAFTAIPLQVDWLDVMAEPEPQMKSSMSTSVSFPTMPSSKDRLQMGLTLAVEASGTDSAIVRLAKPDTDYQVLYYFRREGCWKMYRKNDQSM